MEIRKLPKRELIESYHALLFCNINCAARLFGEFHGIMKKASEEGAPPPEVPRAKAEHMVDMFMTIYPHMNVAQKEFPEFKGTLEWINENAKRIFDSMPNIPTS